MILLFIYVDQELVWTNAVAHYILFVVDHPICTFIFESSVIAVGIYVFCQFTRWLPRLCSPMLASSQLLSPKGAVRVVHHRDFPLVDAVMDSSGVHANFSHHRVSPDLSAMAGQVPPWPWILRTRRVDSRKSNLRVVWRGSQRVNYVYVML